MAFFLVANGLISRRGHHYMEARSFSRIARKRGLEVTVLANKKIEPGICAELDATPLFTYDPYIRRPKWRVLEPLKLGSRAGGEFARNLDSMLGTGPVRADILVVTLTGYRELCGLARWLERIAVNRRPRLALNFMIDDLHLDWKQQRGNKINPLNAWLYRRSLNRIRKLVPDNHLLLTTGGKRFSETMKQVLQAPVLHYPIPVDLELPGASRSTSSGEAPLIGFLGHMRPAKGADIVAPAIRQVLQQNSHCRFVLHASPPEWREHWLAELGQWGDSERVAIVEGELDQDAYNQLMSRIDILLLPYNKADYRIQTSGPFAEAMALGKVVLVPEGTWMSDSINDFGGGARTFSRQDTDDIAMAIISILDAFPTLQAAARKSAGRWREQMGMTAFVDKIIASFR